MRLKIAWEMHFLYCVKSRSTWRCGVERKSIFTGIFPPILRHPHSTYASMFSFGLLVLTKICSVKTALHPTARDFGDSFGSCDAGRLAPVKEQGAKIAQKNRRGATCAQPHNALYFVRLSRLFPCLRVFLDAFRKVAALFLYVVNSEL